MDFFSVLSLLGGLALFLYGMKVMGEGLEKQAGGRLKRTLEMCTSSPLRGMMLGAGVTAAIQSSSATTVMVVGFVNSGIMKLRQSVGVIMGAAIGTTVTAWLISLTGLQGESFIIRLLKPSSFSPIFAIVGVMILMLTKHNKRRDMAMVMIGFAVLMFGMEMMSGAVKPLANDESFVNVLLLFQNPFFGVLAGTVVTMIIQSSSASVGILQALSATGAVTFGTAIPIIIGQNIGTTITAIISSIGASKDGKRAALIHLYFKLIGAALFLGLFYAADAIFHFAFVNTAADVVGIAVVHTAFNLFATAVLMPFSNQLVKLATVSVRDSKTDETFALLDERFLKTPSFAVAQCRTLINDMAKIAEESMFTAMSLMESYNAKGGIAVMEMENKLDMYEDKIGAYLVRLSSESLSVADSQDISTMLHAIGDFERLGDHAVNILETAQEIHEKRITFSPEATEQLGVISAAVHEVLEKTIAAFTASDVALAMEVEPLEQVVDYLKDEIKTRHIKRLQTGECTIELGFILSDILTNYERSADHCSNVAMNIIEMKNHGMAMHEYMSTVKTPENREFSEHYAEYMKKYSI